MAYNNVRFMGYVIDTAPELNPDGSKIYLGLDNPQLDIEARCDLMLRAMEAARDALPPQSPPVPPWRPPSRQSQSRGGVLSPGR